VGFVVMFASVVGTALPSTAAALGGSEPLPPDQPSASANGLSEGVITAAEDWTEFRGPTGQGHSGTQKLPIAWSVTNNVIWRKAIPGLGWSSPVVARGRIYLTTGIISSNKGPSLCALALETATGRMLWQSEVFRPTETESEPLNSKNSHASPTPVVAGDRLYVHFGHNGTACLDLTGKILWRNNTLRYKPFHGSGGSPILVEGKLVYSADGTSDPFVVALDAKTGQAVWKKTRATQAKNKFSFSTPLLITVNGRREIISAGSGVVSALDPKDGREIWRVRYGEGYSVVPRPVYGQGLLFLTTGYDRAEILAIRPDGEGDVTDTHVAWRRTKGAPYTPSLLVVNTEVYAVDDKGLASCLDAKTGMVHWQQRVQGNYSASPVYADGRIYLQNEEGTGIVLKPGRAFTAVATNKVHERCLASCAVAEGAVFLRTAGALYRIGEESP